MTDVFKRIYEKKVESGLEWDKIAKLAGIRIKSWMCGVSYSSPTDEELQKLAPVLNTTYDYLKYGK